jgi:hypothetical protein
MHWMGVLPLCPIARSQRRAMSEIRTVQFQNNADGCGVSVASSTLLLPTAGETLHQSGQR